MGQLQCIVIILTQQVRLVCYLYWFSLFLNYRWHKTFPHSLLNQILFDSCSLCSLSSLLHNLSNRFKIDALIVTFFLCLYFFFSYDQVRYRSRFIVPLHHPAYTRLFVPINRTADSAHAQLSRPSHPGSGPASAPTCASYTHLPCPTSRASISSLNA